MARLVMQMTIHLTYSIWKKHSWACQTLEEASYLIFKWFSDNQGNASICHVLLSTHQEVNVNIGTAKIKNS